MVMRNASSETSILGGVVRLLVVGSFVLAIIDPSIRPMFEELTEVAVAAYIGRYLPASNQRRQK